MSQRFLLPWIVVCTLGVNACAAAASTEAGAQVHPAQAAERVQAVAVRLGAGRLNRQFPNELDDRLYLRGVPIDPRGLTRVAGVVLNFYGQVHADGSCTLDTLRAPSLEPRRLLRDSTPLTIDLLSIVKYQSILDQMGAAHTNFLVADLALRDSQLAEVIVEDIAKVEAADGLNQPAIDSLRRESLPPGICRRAVIAAAYLTSIKSRVYRQTSGQGVVTGLGFGLNGKFFVSNSDFGSNLLLSVDARVIRERPIQSSAMRTSGSVVRGVYPAPRSLSPAKPLAQATTLPSPGPE